MLHKETVTAETLDLIQRLMKDNQINAFKLAGGTALALQLGHRTSIDIDLFNTKAFDAEKLSQHLQKEYGAVVERTRENTISGVINGLKIDLLSHQYKDVQPPITTEGVRMASMEDIAAMKFNAIINNPRRLKDFVDMHYMLEHKNLNQLVQAYATKYPDVLPRMAYTAILYHSEIDKKIPIQLIANEKFVFKNVEKRLVEAVKNPEKVFAQTNGLNIKQEQKLRHDDETKQQQRNKLRPGRH